MKLLFIRHGDPDYEHDTLTAKGRREAALLTDHLARRQIDESFVSPLGRARDTAAATLARLHKEEVICEWLREFPAAVDVSGSKELQGAYAGLIREHGTYRPRILWDMLPSYLGAHGEYLDQARWRTSEAAAHSDIVPVYDRVCTGLDEWLGGYGYVREGSLYRVEKESTNCVALFCHFGITCALLSHLWNVSPFVLWHSLALAPSSITEVVTEERQKGTAHFRALRIGDISHLDAGGEPPSFAARFCEVYSDPDQRH